VIAELIVAEDPAALAADRLATAASAGGNIAMTGGSTPRAAYERLAAMQVDWSACTLWWGDERCVPPDDERSNFRLVREALLDRLTGGSPQVRRIAGERGPQEGADAYEADLREAFGEAPPQFELLLLGLGPDAHCASLFPGQPTLDERERLVVGVDRAGLAPFVPRVTLTLTAINAAREVLFLVAGAGKAAAVERAFAGKPGRDAPASLVAPESGALTVLLDPAAAERLPSTRSVSRRARPPRS
jgi:6-phosphogluconolactonase